MISGQEFERRLRRISQMRDLCIRLRYAALEAYRAGEIPVKPRIDVRSDLEYWKMQLEKRGADQGEPASGEEA
ncbi:MAG TPA: hypothetical protein VM492_18470 [Sumerlaeia bacterium]|nr:hypothetical protein [Sumerlaeia bacterium]